MAGLLDDLSAGRYQKAARGLLGPAYEPLAALPGLLGELSLGADVRDYQAYGSEAVRKALRGDYGQAGLDALWSAAALAGVALPGHASMADPRKLKKKAKPKKVKAKKAKRMTDLPDLRRLPVDEAIAIARKEPHLIPGGAATEGKYIAGPRNVKSKQDLNKIRRGLDASIDAGAKGGDWYDRYRRGVYDVAGGDPEQARWMAGIEGQFSAGVDPASELGYSIKETSGLIGGTPVKAARPAQHAALRKAAATNRLSKLMLGAKTGEYAERVTPGLVSPSATGVNDFRHFRNLGYTDPSGMPVDQVKGTPHIFADYETALAVDRANRRNLAGRSDWTGEQIQATAWVKQKSDDLYARGKKRYDAQALEQMKKARVNDLSPEAVEEAGRKLAFDDANRTIADFFPKHTAYDTYEMQPGPSTGHLPASVNMTQAQRDALAADPRGSFATAPPVAGMQSMPVCTFLRPPASVCACAPRHPCRVSTRAAGASN
jgi:hypothetical protein